MALRPLVLCLLFSLMLWAEYTDAAPCDFNYTINSTIFNAEVTENSINNSSFFNIPVEGNIPGIVLTLIPNNIFKLQGKQLLVADQTALDRETLGETAILRLTCEFNGLINQARIAVKILDVNEFDPEFQGTPYMWHISEFSSVPMTFPVPAMDGDISSRITYTLDQSVPGAEYFNIILPYKEDISLVKALKYEVLDALNLTTIQLIVYATDSNPSGNATGYPIRTGTATVTVSVIDQDDQPPIFQPKVCSTVASGTQLCVNAKYSATVRENELETNIVFAPAQIRAEDGDKGINATIKYTLLSDSVFFKIDENNGQISMKEAVPNKTEITLQIVAYQDDFQKFTITTATIKVVTKNEIRPAFSEEEYCGHVPNNADVIFATMCNSPNILQLQVNDADYAPGEHPIVEYTIVGEGKEHIEIHPNGYVLVRSSNLVAGQEYTFEIEAKDIENGDISQTRLTINVQAGSDGPTVTVPQITAGGSDRPTVPGPQPTVGGSDRPTVTGPHPTDGGSNRPTVPDPRPTPGGSDSPTLPDPRPTSGGPEKIYTAQDMAIVGGVLGALLAVALGVIGFLLFKVLSKKKKAVKIEDDAHYGGGGGDDDGYANSRKGSGQQDDISIGDMGRDDDLNMVNHYIHLPKDHMQDTDVDRSSGYNSVSGRPTTPLLEDTEEHSAPPPQPRDNPAFEADAVATTAAAATAAATAADDEQATHTKSILVTMNSNEKVTNDKAGYKAVWFKDEVIPDGGEAADEADGRAAGGVRFDGEPADDVEGKESSGAAVAGSGLDSSAMHTGGAVAEDDEFASL
ncbi:protocadherin Fat 4-like isoform X43 [Lampetra planeri]